MVRHLGKCPTAGTLTSFRHVIDGVVTAGNPFVDFTVTDWTSPDIYWVPYGAVYRLRLRFGFRPTSPKNWFFAGHQVVYYNATADDALFNPTPAAIFWAAEDVIQTGTPKIGVAGTSNDEGSYGFQSFAYAAGDPAGASQLSASYICNPPVDVDGATFAGAVPDYRVLLQPATDYRARAFHRSELTLGNFEGTDYLMTSPLTHWFKTDPCATKYECPLVFRSAVFRGSDFLTSYSADLDVRSSLLIQLDPDPNY